MKDLKTLRENNMKYNDIDEGLIDNIKKSLQLKPKTQREAMDELIDKAHSTAEKLKLLDKYNAPVIQKAVDDFTNVVNKIANDLWTRFEDKDEETKSLIMQLWKQTDAILGIVNIYASKLHEIINNN